MKSAKIYAALLAAAGLAGLLLASPVLAGTSADVALERIERVLDDVEQLQRIMQDRPHEVDSARERLLRKQAELERERVHAMSRAARVSERRVESMRAQGLSWGRIAQELRVSPFVVGVATGHNGERDYRHGHDRDDDERFEQWRGKDHGQKKGWKDGMPPGQAKKHGRD
ncbi:MAG: hypothetical protein KKA55_14470 [Proteobacteria bacterium]|nr:hypothetical protein [Pseudomonadota bacterium]MBU1596724.1 hypothetical protein [Pseudomonadota bacterium]